MHNRVDKSPSKAIAPVQDAGHETATPDLSSAPIVGSRPESIVFQRVQNLSNQFAQNHSLLQLKENTTGMPDQLKSGIESLSGVDVSDVQVHFNSSKPAQLNAHAYAQGNQIHVAPQQEKHLPHEAWHVVQQKQGRVKPTAQLKQKVAINDDSQLEREADVMGAKAMHVGGSETVVQNKSRQVTDETIVQRVWKGTVGGVYDSPTTQQWDQTIAGLNWFYNSTSDKYFYVVENTANLVNPHGDMPQDLNAPPNQATLWRRSIMEMQYEEKTNEEWLAVNEIHLPHGLLRPDGAERHSYAIAQGPVFDLIHALFLNSVAAYQPLLHAELKATGDVNSAGMEAYATHVRNNIRGYLAGYNWVEGADNLEIFRKGTSFVQGTPPYNEFLAARGADKDILTAFRRVIFSQIGSRAEDEPGFGAHRGAADYATGIESHSANVHGIMIHLSTRTRAGDIQLATQAVTRLAQTFNNISAQQLADLIRPNLAADSTAALTTLESTTGLAPDALGKQAVADEAATIPAATILTYATAVRRRWIQALNNNIHIVFDRAKLTDTFGASEQNEAATPANLMADGGPGLAGKQRISVNLDANAGNQLILTLAHEFAHAIGFNPSGVPAIGHFNQINRYLEEEGDHGLKILFDAYYIETLYSRL